MVAFYLFRFLWVLFVVLIKLCTIELGLQESFKSHFDAFLLLREIISILIGKILSELIDSILIKLTQRVVNIAKVFDAVDTWTFFDVIGH